MLALAARGQVKAQITTFPLKEAAIAYEAPAAGQLLGRAVVVPYVTA